MRAAALLALAAIVGGGCTPGTPPAAMMTVAVTPIAPAVTGSATEPVLSITATTGPTATAEPFVPFAVVTWADNVVLRTNPGYLFSKLGILKKGTSLRVMGRSPGGEWLLVQTPDSRAGWVFQKLVETEGREMDRVPTVLPDDVLVVRGRVNDVGGSPINGIQFALVQGSGSDAPRADALTDETGLFHVFMPMDSGGTWWLSYTAISCESRIMDASCSNWAGQPFPKGVYIDLPQAAQSIQEFVWK